MRTLFQRGIGRFFSALLLLGVVGVLSGCCGCTPAVGEQPWLVGVTTTDPGPAITTSTGIQKNALVQVERDPFGPLSAPELPAAEPPESGSTPAAFERRGTRIRGEGNKYSKSLREIEVERDRASYGEFYDWGYWSGTAWAGYKDLPPGYWVYVAPDWYIFGKARGANVGQNPPTLGKRKYGKLLRKIKVEEDVSSYGEYYDYGHYSGTSYYGCKDLPSGYWVYTAPYWYIFGEANPLAVMTTRQPTTPKRSWGPEQATGPPDTARAGDISTAWASRTADEQNEWLRLYYAKPVVPAAVHIYETYNPGALYRITARNPNGQELEVWSGDDPVPVGSGKGMAAIALEVHFPTNCITIYLKSKEFAGWNEIDAVGLLDVSEDIQWAVSAEASSTWASSSPQPVPITPQSNRQRIEQLEIELKQLQNEVRQLRQRIR